MADETSLQPTPYFGELTGKVFADDGSMLAPSMSFDRDKDTGFYRPSTNTIGITNAGRRTFTFDEDGLLTSETSNYELLVINDNDIANKKYVDDAIAASGAGDTEIMVSTVDATATTIHTQSMSSGTTFGFAAFVSCIRTDIAGTVGGYFEISGAYRNQSGTIIRIGVMDTKKMFRDDDGLDINSVISGTNVLIKVTGLAAKTFDWKGLIRIVVV